jgi:hypothetical protein
MTVEKVPVWGTAVDLIDVLDVRPASERRYVNITRTRTDQRRPVVEGSQILVRPLRVRAL